MESQPDEAELAEIMAAVARDLTERSIEIDAERLAANESAINAELIGVEGKRVDIGGYYRPDAAKTTAVMRPSSTFNGILDGLV